MASSVVGKSSIASLALHFSLGCYGAICKLVQDTIARRIQELGKLLQASPATPSRIPNLPIIPTPTPIASPTLPLISTYPYPYPYPYP